MVHEISTPCLCVAPCNDHLMYLCISWSLCSFHICTYILCLWLGNCQMYIVRIKAVETQELLGL